MAAPVITVGLGALDATDDPGAVLVTHALGSCVAVIAWDAGRRVGGMLHFQLPSSALDPARAAASPGTFADTGIPALFERMYALGARRADIAVKVAGGAAFHGALDVGRRNLVAMRKIFWKAAVLVSAEDVGGERSRTVRLFVDTGRVTVRSGSDEVSL